MSICLFHNYDNVSILCSLFLFKYNCTLFANSSILYIAQILMNKSHCKSHEIKVRSMIQQYLKVKNDQKEIFDSLNNYYILKLFTAVNIYDTLQALLLLLLLLLVL